LSGKRYCVYIYVANTYLASKFDFGPQATLLVSKICITADEWPNEVLPVVRPLATEAGRVRTVVFCLIAFSSQRFGKSGETTEISKVLLKRFSFALWPDQNLATASTSMCLKFVRRNF